MKKILIHGLGHTAKSWTKTMSYMEHNTDILCPDLRSILDKKEASYQNLYSSFAGYCSKTQGQIHLCGISIGGMLALEYALEFPDKIKSLVLIGTPHKVPKAALAIQTAIFRFLPQSVFKNMAFNKKDTFVLGNSMKQLDFTNRISTITCPTLIICGKKDKANLKSAHYLCQNMKNASLTIMEHTGHAVNEEAPKALAEALDGFWENSI